MTSQIRSIVDNCPNTKIVVGGYSLGAAVTNDVLNNTLPPGADQHIAAVVLIGNASRLLNIPVTPARPSTASRSTYATPAIRSARAAWRH